ncbi:uncharacterized protein shroom4 [Eucyclogobius newberryi]|uniref:uncharacterized protein shroom4 n=1 Tax=Eucyclogobius newberryi TaxID=166745 RepID=UPI003B5953C2
MDVPVLLSGGAPWGFTLKGGLEHGEPLVITKIEAGGKAAQCQRLRVGDELITINGTVLFGSRQEALILIKGSYRVLKLTVRRRSAPAVRPHSWHLDQISEPVFPPPPPPPSPPCAPPSDATPLPPPPCAMQLHPGPRPLTWHHQHSELSLQWGALSCPYSSGERSSSLGSVESLDTPTPAAQTNYDPHNSPVDPALFNNKRDSAYSSFSASSSASDYAAVPLRFSEGGSMENLLDGESRPGSGDGRPTALKSRSLTRPRPKASGVKERPSSCCYEDGRQVGDFGILQNGNSETTIKSDPPRPPARNDSFRATKLRPNARNDRCASAPIESYADGTSGRSAPNGLPASEKDDESLDSFYVQNKAPLTSSNAQTSIFRPHTKQSANVLHRHSAPDKLLATQLQLLHFHDAPMEAYVQPKSTGVSSSGSVRWSQAEDHHDSSLNHQTLTNQWSGSRCSTPGSVFLEDGVEEFRNDAVNCERSTQVSWGRSVSVPEEPAASSDRKKNLDQVDEKGFEPISSALSVDALVEKKIEVLDENSATLKKSTRNHRKNRRRNERFATNLRNEIQRKKAQLQSSRGPGGLLCSGETVHEEDPEFHEDGEFQVPERIVAFAPTTAATAATTAATTAMQHPSRTIESSSVEYHEDVPHSTSSTSAQVVDSGVASFGIRVIEEPAPAGKARRWRWTPEHKLRPENEPRLRRGEGKLPGVAPSRHGVCAYMSSTPTSAHPRSVSCSRMEESDLLPFADRKKFFEETSKTGVGNAASRPEWESGDLGPYQPQRRYSYQGGYRDECSSLMEARRRSVDTKERARERVEERARERVEERARERVEERARERVEERARERDEDGRPRKWVRELERVQEMDRIEREKDGTEREGQECSRSTCRRGDDHGSLEPGEFERSRVSAFYPVKSSAQRFGDQRQTPAEVFPARQQETTQLNRKYSLTERDYSSRRWERRPHERSDSNGLAPPPSPLRTRAMSESDLRFDAHLQRWSPSPCFAGARTLSEVDEGVDHRAREEPAKKKTPPPPRPPPPKWEQFHKRRASHHAIHAPSAHNATGVASSSETSRQRSYSLPPQREDLISTNTCTSCSCHQNLPRDQENARNPHHGRQNLQYSREEVLQDRPKPKNLHQHPHYNHEEVLQDRPKPKNLHQHPHYNHEEVLQDHPKPKNLHQHPHYNHEEVLQDHPKPKNLHQHPHYNHEEVLQDHPKPPNSKNNYQNRPQDKTLQQNFQYDHQSLPHFPQYTHDEVLQDQPQPHISKNNLQNRPQDQTLPQNPQYKHQYVQEEPKHHNVRQNSTQNHQQSVQTQDLQQYNQGFPSYHVSTNRIQAPRGLSNHNQPPDASKANQIPPLSVSSDEIQPLRVQNAPAFVWSNRQQPSHVPPPPCPVPPPPCPMFSRRSFRPVAPPQWNDRGSVEEETDEFPPPPPPVADDFHDFRDFRDFQHSFSNSGKKHVLNQEQISQKTSSTSRLTAEWERTTSPMVHSGSVFPPPPPFPSIKTDVDAIIEPQNMGSETTLSPSPSLDTDLDVPLETDIDDFQEEELVLLPAAIAPINSELPCLALPVTVLETDLDTLPEAEGSLLDEELEVRDEGSLLDEELEVRDEGSLLDEELEVRDEGSLLDEELEVRDEGSLLDEELEVELEVRDEGSLLDEMFPQSSEGESGTESWRAASQSTEHNSLDRRSGASSSCSSYYSTSTAKALLLTQMKDLTEQRERDNQDELMYKKQLMESLRKKLGVLREAQRGLQEDIRANAQLGDEVEAMVVSRCKHNEVDKFRMFIGDLYKVVSLLLSLSGRLLRVETTLDTLESEDEHEERLPLLEKKRQLLLQLSEAQDLKDHVDGREQAVSRVLGRVLSPEQHRDYSHFVKMKAALLVEQKQLEDKIRLGEEQLRGLRESLGLGLGAGLGAGLGLALGYGQY